MNHKNFIIRDIGFLYQISEQINGPVAGIHMSSLKFLKDAYLVAKNGIIEDFGSMSSFEETMLTIEQTHYNIISAEGGSVLPTYCDAHTHIVFPAWRAQEFADRIQGFTYQEIASRGGGILNSVHKLRQTDEEILFELALERISNMIKMGTGAIEIKSGYGLSLESEIKMLRVIRKLKETVSIDIKATFLGAHAVPLEYKERKSAYINHIINDMLPRIAEENLADYCDIFCEQNYFDHDDTLRLLESASAFGIKGRVHAEQMSHSRGIEAGVKAGARSVDHLEFINEQDISLLLKSNTMPVLLPGAAFFLKLPYPPARRMIDAGLPVALSTDFNPGSCPCGNMNMMLTFACINMGMSIHEAFNAATLNSAVAMDLENQLGSITTGKKANLIITKPSIELEHIPYLFADTSWIKEVMI